MVSNNRLRLYGGFFISFTKQLCTPVQILPSLPSGKPFLADRVVGGGGDWFLHDLPHGWVKRNGQRDKLLQQYGGGVPGGGDLMG